MVSVPEDEARINRGLSAAWLVLSALLLASGLGLSAQAAAPREYQLKAVFLFNFAQFVEWPPQAFADARTPLVIGVLGRDPFGAYLDETVRGERVNNRSLVVQRYGRVEDINTCHILFISRSEGDRLEQILARLRDRNILTVADAEGSALPGVMIRLVTVENKIRLQINLEVAQAANLRISSKLLRPAEIVTSGND
ncbi:MAG: hypothetical protein USCGTAYLOR_02949 [Chromatiales bacterium USCg_Taylor]|nr:MAG: hypothetical protein USCGTAYLOR_02949 [Chromatiales bacterium USCg_Taylor]